MADGWGPAKSERDDVLVVVVVVVDFVALGDMVDDVEVVVVFVDAVVDRLAVAFVDVIVDEANVGVTSVDAWVFVDAVVVVVVDEMGMDVVVWAVGFVAAAVDVARTNCLDEIPVPNGRKPS